MYNKIVNNRWILVELYQNWDGSILVYKGIRFCGF